MSFRRPDLNEQLEDAAACRCDGTGWVQVLPSYADRKCAPLLAARALVPEAELEAFDRALASALATHANSVYPCRACRPRLFYRWAGGHLHPEHNREACDECSGPTRTRRRALPPATPDPEPTRKDLE